MTIWDGKGLPPAAEARMRRFQASPVRTSLLSVPAAVSIDAVGLDPVGEVMGCIVEQIGWAGYGGCGYYGGSMYSTIPTPVVNSRTRFSAFAPYVQALNNGYETAMRRMLIEARDMGADGVVGVKLTMDHLTGSSSNREFVALGTAVRARSRTRPSWPFTTDLPGTDVAKLLLAGWTPVALQVGLEVAIRHDDYVTQQQAGSRFWNTANVEVSGYTELVQHARASARDRFDQKIAQVGADGAVVSDMRMNIWEIEPNDGHRDHVAEATIIGTAIVRFHREAAPRTSTLTMLPLRPIRRP